MLAARPSAPPVVPVLLAALMLGAGPRALAAQSFDDGLMVPKRGVMVGVVYSREQWDEYWEGTLKRSNGNIGTLTTQSATLVTGYGLTSRITLLATVPYIQTHASQGTLQDMSGVQDLSIAAKYRILGQDATPRGFSAFVVAAAAVPMSDYTPDFMPLSIGTGGSRASARLTLDYQSAGPWFATASGAYTFCNNVQLDRKSYFTDGQLFQTSEVAMPNVMDYTFTTGIRRGRWQLPVSLVQRQTLGGGDIRRQDMPFVSNRMNFTRVGAEGVYALNSPGPGGVSLRAGGARVLSGRNVGQSTTLTAGVVYGLDF